MFYVRDGEIVEMTDDDHAAIEAARAGAVNAQDTPPTYSKVMLFKAMTDEEFSTFQTVKAMQSDRKQAVFDNATVLDSADDDFIDFQMLMLGTFGNDRAEELLNAAKL